MEKFSQPKRKPHAVCVPLPFQSHINAMLKLAKVLHFKGFHITFVNTEFNHQRVLISRGPDSLNGLPDFRFETIPDGLPPPSDIYATQEISPLLDSITKTGPVHFHNLITRLNQASASSPDPPVSCIVSDIYMIFTVELAQELGIPQLLWYPVNATTLLLSLYKDHIFHKFSSQLKKDESHFTNEFLGMPVDFIPGLDDFRLKDISRLVRDFNVDPKTTQESHSEYKQRVGKASAVILNTFDALEGQTLHSMKPPADCPLPAVYTIGPLHFLEQEITDKKMISFGVNLLKEHHDCLEWLDSRQKNSVLYVNFGSTTIMTQKQFIEFAWGLANSKHPFLWVIRPNLVVGEAATLPPDFIGETADRSMISGWCPQEKVLSHSSIGGFLTHSGWNSIMDAMCTGVPMIHWPFFGDQQPNCRLACAHWGIGIEIDNDVKREDVEKLVRELMTGEKGKEMRRKSMEWKKKAKDSTKPGGSSYVNLEKIVTQVLVQKENGLNDLESNG